METLSPCPRPQLELQCLESLRGPDIDLEARIPVVRKTDGTVLVGEAAPRRADLEAWLQAHPDFAIDPRFLAVSVALIWPVWGTLSPTPPDPHCAPTLLVHAAPSVCLGRVSAASRAVQAA